MEAIQAEGVHEQGLHTKKKDIVGFLAWDGMLGGSGGKANETKLRATLVLYLFGLCYIYLACAFKGGGGLHSKRLAQKGKVKEVKSHDLKQQIAHPC